MKRPSFQPAETCAPVPFQPNVGFSSAAGSGAAVLEALRVVAGVLAVDAVDGDAAGDQPVAVGLGHRDERPVLLAVVVVVLELRGDRAPCSSIPLPVGAVVS